MFSPLYVSLASIFVLFLLPIRIFDSIRLVNPRRKRNNWIILYTQLSGLSSQITSISLFGEEDSMMPMKATYSRTCNPYLSVILIGICGIRADLGCYPSCRSHHSLCTLGFGVLRHQDEERWVDQWKKRKRLNGTMFDA